MQFALALHTDDGIRYGVTVPDLPGCFSGGDTLDEAIDAAKEAIDAHVELLIQDGQQLPEAKTLAAHQSNSDFAGALWALIEVPVEKYFGPAEKVNITVPAMILRRIDNYAQRHGETRSAFLVRAAERSMRE
jgi:predicted RNase H-like HicB family nuclease